MVTVCKLIFFSQSSSYFFAQISYGSTTIINGHLSCQESLFKIILYPTSHPDIVPHEIANKAINGRMNSHLILNEDTETKTEVMGNELTFTNRLHLPYLGFHGNLIFWKFHSFSVRQCCDKYLSNRAPWGLLRPPKLSPCHNQPILATSQKMNGPL